MAFERDDSHDELIWSSADAVREVDPWNNAIHENTVLFYFAKSPFFSNASKNKILLDQNNPNVVQDREHFEAALRSQPGLEYVVAFGPKDFGGEAPLNVGRWVIRKQLRARDQEKGGWDVQLLDTFFVIGQAVCHSPRVADVLWTRLLSATSSVRKLLDAASGLTLYTPALGYHYVSPSLQSSSTAATVAKSQSTRASSTVGTPPPPLPTTTTMSTSREATPAAVDANQNRRASSRAPAATVTSAPGKAAHTDLTTLTESFNQFLKYGSEYMDENPLVGEPGSFAFTNTRQSLNARAEAARRNQEAATALRAKPEATSKAATPQPSAPPTPKIEVALPQESTKAKPKRRKSKAAASPSSPLALASPVGE